MDDCTDWQGQASHPEPAQFQLHCDGHADGKTALAGTDNQCLPLLCMTHNNVSLGHQAPAALVLDWHNFGYSLMAMSMGRQHWLVGRIISSQQYLMMAWHTGWWGEAFHSGLTQFWPHPSGPVDGMAALAGREKHLILSSTSFATP